MSLRPRVALWWGITGLTLAQAYAVYAILFFAWLSATPVQHPERATLNYMRWLLISIPIGLLWIASAILLYRTRRPRDEYTDL